MQKLKGYEFRAYDSYDLKAIQRELEAIRREMKAAKHGVVTHDELPT